MATIENGNHWRSIFVYLFFVAIVVGALLLYQGHTNARFERVDDASCANRRVLVANQRVVLMIIARNVREFLRLTKGPRQHAYFTRTHQLVIDAQRKLDQTLVCS